MYTYQAKVLNIHDGDTIKVSLRLKHSRAKNADLGFHVYYEYGFLVLHTNIRFLGINAPELSTEAGVEALAYLQSQLSVGDIVTLKTNTGKPIDPDKYGDRWDALVFKGNTNLNDLMVSTGHAVNYVF